MINGLRFIIGSGCNYNCFFCHHEGYEKQDDLLLEKEKLDKIYNFAINNNIKDISITGGEPFLYWEKLIYILNLFRDNYFKITLNSNFVLADKYIGYLKEYKNIEYHINFSTLNENKHKIIIKKDYLKKLKQNLELYKQNDSSICLNIPVLEGINTDELINILLYANENGFKARYLVLLPMNEEQKQYLCDVNGIMSYIPNSQLLKKYSYGRHDITSTLGNYEIVKCLCVDEECDLCKKTTYIHLTPDLNMRLCMKSGVEYPIDYTDQNTVEKSFNELVKRLKI